jgi:hypothetical protein
VKLSVDECACEKSVDKIKSQMGQEYLKKATRSCGLAAILFGFQYVDNLSPSALFPTSDIFVWVGLIVGAIAILYSVFVVEFLWNPDYHPPITLYLVIVGLDL